VRTSGAPAGEICFQGATFLNDIGMDRGGTLYVTDSGLKPDFSASGTDAIWRFSPDGQTSKLQQGDSLGRPNGIAFNEQGGYVVTFGTGEIYQFGPDNKRRSVLPGASARALDGIVFTKDGGYAFSSWGDTAVYTVDAQGNTAKLLTGDQADSPADIGYDARRNRILVPLFTPNKVVIKPIPAAAPAAPTPATPAK
jgi:sugar lactone lactonase YvrE